MADVENVVPAALREAVAVLDRDDRNDCAGARELPRVHVRHADVPNLALGPELAERTDGRLDRNGGVGRVQLVDVDPLEA